MTNANEIAVGTLVRSYDFVGSKNDYVEGVLEKVGHAPPEVCPGNCDHIHIKITKVVRRGKDVTSLALAGIPDDKKYVYPALSWNNVEVA